MKELEDLYRTANAQVRPHTLDRDRASAYYKPFIDFVIRSSADARGELLDVGCGDGWSSALLSEQGFSTTAVDLHSNDFTPAPHEHLRFEPGSALDLPFPEARFDVVVSHQMLEHVLVPERALLEMVRVLKPGGLLCVVSPNLLSPLASLRGLTRYAWQNRPYRTIFFRRPGMPRHPFGNTLPETAFSLAQNSLRILSKLASSKAQFTMREPDLVPPFHADNDATYLCNPIDLMKALPPMGCSVTQLGAYDRPVGTWLLASGTWIAARKNHH